MSPPTCVAKIDTRIVRPSRRRRCTRAETAAPIRKPTLAIMNIRPMRPALVMQRAHEVQEQHDLQDRVEVVRRGGAARDQAQRPVPEDVAEPFTDLGAHRGPLGFVDRLDRRFGALRCATPRAPTARSSPRRREPQTGAPNAWINTPAAPGPAICAPDRLISSFAVAVGELIAVDERGEVRLVRDVEEHREHTGHEDDGEELREGEHVRSPTRSGSRTARSRARCHRASAPAAGGGGRRSRRRGGRRGGRERTPPR